ncbi:phosphodiester glycosidase family protein [Salegentibacter sp. F14]
MKFPKIILLVLGLFCFECLLAQQITSPWKAREDLNILLPESVKIYDTYRALPDGSPLRAMYAEIDLSDKNLKLRSLGSNSIRETTKETYERGNGILAINGGYFSSNSSVSLIVEDGEMIAYGPTENLVRGAFGMHGGKPEVVWTNSKNKEGYPKKFEKPDLNAESQTWRVSQAVGGGPVLLKNGKIKLTDKEEGFSGSHLQRHPRTAIGYKDDNSLIMMVVDGRQQASAGVSLPELAQLMLEVGALEAINLDGGDSSTMVASEEVVNVPSDITGGNRNSLRNNAGALVLSQIQPSREKELIIFDTDGPGYSETGIWKNSNQVNYYGKTSARIASSNSLNKSSYAFKDIERKRYQLAVWFPVDQGENSAEVNYILHRNSRKDTIQLNQQNFQNLGKWNVLGTYEIGPEDKLEIMGVTKGKFVADAIRLVARERIPELPKRGDVRIAVISDLNSGLGTADYQWQVDSIINRIPKLWQPDLVICGGDMVAGMGISRKEQLQKMWKGFDEHIAQPLKKAGIPFAFTLGNHDGPRSYPLERKFARDFWRKNKNRPELNFVDDTHFPNYYSFIENGIFFVSWEASSSKITEENLKWLEQQFKTSEARNAKLRFVMGHMPLYSVAQERDSKGNVLEEPERLQKLLEKYGVHTYISGHQHAYYPGKKGKLQLLNAGAAGSGPRGWIAQNKKPINTISILDVFHEKDTLIYSTYDIKEKDAGDMTLIEEESLSSAIFGINGYLIRRDITRVKQARAFLSSLNIPNSDSPGIAHARAKVIRDQLHISGNYFNLQAEGKSLGLHIGRNTENGELLRQLKITESGNGSGRIEGELSLTEELKDYLAIGGLYLEFTTSEGKLRGQFYPKANTAPTPPKITSHSEQNTYGIRDITALYVLKWDESQDKNGDFVNYSYQLSKDPNFSEIVFQKKTGRETSVKMSEKEWFKFLGEAEIGETVTFYHRVLASDGSNFSTSGISKFSMTKSDEILDDLAEIPAPEYVFKGKIRNSGAGYGAQWDGEGKLWLADYNQGLIIQNNNYEEVDFSPLDNVEINNQIYKLNPVNGIGVDLDGNILVGINRRLIKIDAKTGKGIAVWEAPEGARAITAPRASKNGEIYAMSLFGEDPNYVLKQNGKTFDLIRTLSLKDRKLSRTFDMTADAKTLYFPDPGSPKIQVYTKNGGKYRKEADISSINAGSSAIRVIGNSVYLAVRSSGVNPSGFHYRNEEKQQMWTLELPEVKGAEPRGIGVSKDEKSLIFCSWDKGGGYYLFERSEQ